MQTLGAAEAGAAASTASGGTVAISASSSDISQSFPLLLPSQLGVLPSRNTDGPNWIVMLPLLVGL